ncbi:hypothetical protein HispidOSU_019375, partial [Sigmodon hispidus]
VINLSVKFSEKNKVQKGAVKTEALGPTCTCLSSQNVEELLVGVPSKLSNFL